MNYHDILSAILTAAGELIMEYRQIDAAVIEKEKNEIVTPADIAANDFIVSELAKHFPGMAIYTEEGANHKSAATTRWIVDPIDGTTPWVWGNSGFAISVALEEQGVVTVAAVYDPVMKEFFYAEQGKGAMRNGQKIGPSAEQDVSAMFMVVDWGNKDEKRKEGLEYYSKLMLPDMFARRMVPQFAPALGLCRIAEGRIHALICNDTWVEDHAAGALILQEAGGYCTNFYQTESFQHRQSGILAANSQVTHAAIRARLVSEE
jgi:myo-inositol-1(or 4)-monophosphatase